MQIMGWMDDVALLRSLVGILGVNFLLLASNGGIDPAQMIGISIIFELRGKFSGQQCR